MREQQELGTTNPEDFLSVLQKQEPNNQVQQVLTDNFNAINFVIRQLGMTNES